MKLPENLINNMDGKTRAQLEKFIGDGSIANIIIPALSEKDRVKILNFMKDKVTADQMKAVIKKFEELPYSAINSKAVSMVLRMRIPIDRSALEKDRELYEFLKTLDIAKGFL